MHGKCRRIGNENVRHAPTLSNTHTHTRATFSFTLLFAAAAAATAARPSSIIVSSCVELPSFCSLSLSPSRETNYRRRRAGRVCKTELDILYDRCSVTSTHLFSFLRLFPERCLSLSLTVIVSVPVRCSLLCGGNYMHSTTAASTSRGHPSP